MCRGQKRLDTIVRPNLSPYRTVPCPYRVRTVPYRVRTVPCPYRFPFFLPFFTASATVTVPFFSLTVRIAKRTEPKWESLTVEDREPHRTKRVAVIRLYFRTANRTAIRTAPILVRYGSYCI